MPGYTPTRPSCYLPDNVAPSLQNVPSMAAPYQGFNFALIVSWREPIQEFAIGQCVAVGDGFAPSWVC